MSVIFVFRVVLSVCFCTGRFVMVLSILTYLHSICLQHMFSLHVSLIYINIDVIPAWSDFQFSQSGRPQCRVPTCLPTAVPVHNYVSSYRASRTSCKASTQRTTSSPGPARRWSANSVGAFLHCQIYQTEKPF